jgi:uncharacterized protein
MNIKWIEESIDYDGSQLRSGWIEKVTQLTPDVLVGFVGGCNVTPEFMVDQEDLKAGHTIFSHKMLHFIGEFQDMDLERAILKQRLLISQIQQLLQCHEPSLSLLRTGNDLYEEDQYKMTISVATTSEVSSLIHAGINIESEGTPVPTKGLKELYIHHEPLAQAVLRNFQEELKSVPRDITKVKKVP